MDFFSSVVHEDDDKESIVEVLTINVVSNKDILLEEVDDDDDDIRNVAFPSYLIHTFPQLHTLELNSFKQAEVVFKIAESSNCKKLGNKEDVELIGMKRNKTHYDGSQLILVSQQQPTISSLSNLTSITLVYCDRMKYLFSPLIAKLLPNLVKIDLHQCKALEQVVSNIDDEYDEEMAASISSHTNTTFFPHLA
ncbi:hypothetical protein OSB04_028590 [Centaurea solstitialis]|uniref:Disease resistance protein At4g27190-like leucine-rich repeats domain-containing protein n=1 Tax=Centaurea solstitialis TaxID=347529 RepID=A0AA38SFW2_9ASTR|nr:hypothetical protein OSB04_028590 [Centaurea solstitialis]